MGRETLLVYPDFSKAFNIHTDASNIQLGAVISQEERPIAFYSRKLNPAQTFYATTKRKLLSMVEVLKEFRNILLGYQIVVHTDHKDLVCQTLNFKRVMCWRLYVQDYSPDFRCIMGENYVAEAPSRLEIAAEPLEETFFTEELHS